MSSKKVSVATPVATTVQTVTGKRPRQQLVVKQMLHTM